MPSADYVTSLIPYHVTITSANTQYSQQLPEFCNYLKIQAQDGTALRVAFVTGKVATPTAPYWTILANGALEIRGAWLNKVTVYVACASGSKTAEILAGVSGTV